MGSAGRVVLVTGVSRDLGRRFARAAADDPAVARVIGVDAVPPRGDIGDVSFVRADIRNPVIAKVIVKEDVDTVVHMSVISTPGSAGGRNTMKELNVIGTMQLLAACQKAPGLRSLVVKSTTTVYGASSRDPAMFTEDMEPRRVPRAGLRQGRRRGRGLRPRLRPPPPGRPGHAAPGRERDRARTSTARSRRTSGCRSSRPCSATTRGCSSCTSATCSAVLRHATLTDVAGTFNVAGDGMLMLSQAVRRLQRPTIGLPPFAVGSVGSAAPLGPARRLLARAARAAHLRPRRRHHPDAHRARLRAGVHDRRGARRLRRAAAAHRRPHRAAARPGRQEPARARPGRATAPGRGRRPARGPTMGDAEIIPIGTRGRPGRGTGKQPSSAARGLAPHSRAAKKARRPPRRRRQAAARSRKPRSPSRSPSHRGARRGAGRSRPPGGDHRRPHAHRRHPRGRLAGRDPVRRPRGVRRAVGAPARPVPRVPAPPGDRRLRRRRVRLRPGDHPALLHGRRCARSRRSGSASRCAAPRTSRPTAARWSSPTTPAPSRSTG